MRVLGQYTRELRRYEEGYGDIWEYKDDTRE